MQAPLCRDIYCSWNTPIGIFSQFIQEMLQIFKVWNAGEHTLRTPKVLIICSIHVTYAFESESTLHNCLNVKELLAQTRRDILRFSDNNGIRTHNHLVYKRTPNHLAKLAKSAFALFPHKNKNV